MCRQLVLYPDGCDHEHTGIMGVFLKYDFPVITSYLIHLIRPRLNAL
jgi:hypothetical protein